MTYDEMLCLLIETYSLSEKKIYDIINQLDYCGLVIKVDNGFKPIWF